MKTITRWLLAFAAACLAVPAFSQTSVREYNLEMERQPLAAALTEFSKQTGLQIGYFPETLTENILIGPLSGRYTAEAAISQLLLPSGLSFERLNERTIAVTGPESAKSKSRGFSTIEQKTDHRAALSFVRLANVRLAERAGTERDDQQIKTAANARESDGKKRLHGALEEVIVTAQKREQSVQDVPISITALNGEYMENAGIQNISQLTYSVPSLSSVELGPGFQHITIRGVGNVRGSGSLIGLYLDEAAVAGANEQQIDLRLFDLARVEVLRGPQGTLYGEGSVGGTIRYITNDPDLDDFTGNLEVSAFGTHKGGTSQAVKGVANVPLVEDKFGIRIAAIYEDTAGWIDQPAAGREDINNSDLRNIRLKSLWRVSEDFNIKGTGIVHRNEGDGYNYVNLGPNRDSNYAPALNPTMVTPYEDNYEHFGLTLDYDLGFASLVSATSYTDMDKLTFQSYRLPFLPVGSPVLGFNDVENQDIRLVTQELRLTSTDAEKLKWTVGAFYRDSDNSIVGNFNYEGFLYNGSGAGSSESVAFFGDAEYALTDRVSIGAGARYYEDHLTVVDRLAGTQNKANFNAVSPRAYLSFAATKNIKAYASVSKGFRSGGFNTPNAIALGAPAGIKPEVLWNYEVGTKMDLFNGRVGADLAFFYSDYDDYISEGYISGSDILAYQVLNAGTVEIRGVEWQLVWNASDHLRLGTNGSVLDPEVTKITTINGPSIVGEKPDNTVSNEYSVFLDSSFKWSANVAGFLRMNYNVQGKMYYHDWSGPPGLVVPVDSSDRVEFLDVHIGGQWDRWTAELFGSNLTDESGFVTAYSSYGAAVQARPRSVGVKVGVEF